jgi:hypothetical protein
VLSDRTHAKSYSEALRGIGLETVRDLASITDIDGSEELPGIPAKVLHIIRLRVISYASGEILQTEPFEFPISGLSTFDILTDPACSRVWLIGFLVDCWFTQLYSNSWEEDRHILERAPLLMERPYNRRT